MESRGKRTGRVGTTGPAMGRTLGRPTTWTDAKEPQGDSSLLKDKSVPEEKVREVCPTTPVDQSAGSSFSEKEQRQ